MSWVMQVKIDEVWKTLHPSGEPKRFYRYDTQDKAEMMLRRCYPDQCREIRLGGEPTVRVTPMEAS